MLIFVDQLALGRRQVQTHCGRNERSRTMIPIPIVEAPRRRSAASKVSIFCLEYTAIWMHIWNTCLGMFCVGLGHEGECNFKLLYMFVLVACMHEVKFSYERWHVRSSKTLSFASLRSVSVWSTPTKGVLWPVVELFKFRWNWYSWVLCYYSKDQIESSWFPRLSLLAIKHRQVKNSSSSWSCGEPLRNRHRAANVEPRCLWGHGGNPKFFLQLCQVVSCSSLRIPCSDENCPNGADWRTSSVAAMIHDMLRPGS